MVALLTVAAACSHLALLVVWPAEGGQPGPFLLAAGLLLRLGLVTAEHPTPLALGLRISPLSLTASSCSPCLCLPSLYSTVVSPHYHVMNLRNIILSIALVVLFGATVACADE